MRTPRQQQPQQQPQPYDMTPPGKRHRADNTHPEAVALVKRMGSKKGYSPLPPDQHGWQKRKGEPPKHRIWSWMADHTVAWGHRCEYAVDKNGNELHIEHLAADLDMDLANAYLYWKEGEAEGLWHRGTKAEGERRLFFSGNVPEPKPEGEETANQIVCAYNLPAVILKKTKDWSPERVRELDSAWKSIEDLDRILASALMAARRRLIDQEQDNLLNRYGVKLNRQEHVKNGETDEDAKARRARVEPLLVPLELYVRTIRESAQSSNGTSHNGANGSAHTASSLLPVFPLMGGEESQAGGTLDGHSAHPETPPCEGEKSLNQVHTVPNTGGSGRKPAKAEQPKSENLQTQIPELQTDEDREAENLLFTQIRHWQEAFPREAFGADPVQRGRRCDQAIVRYVVRRVGAQNVPQLCLSIMAEFRGVNRNVLGKAKERAPGKPDGPRSLGWVQWYADQYAARLDEAARVDPFRVPARERADEIRWATQTWNNRAASLDDRWAAQQLLAIYGVKPGGSQ